MLERVEAKGSPPEIRVVLNWMEDVWAKMAPPPVRLPAAAIGSSTSKAAEDLARAASSWPDAASPHRSGRWP